MKRVFAMILALCLMIGQAPVTVSAAAFASGTCGENLTWVLDGDGTLTISGTGEMENYWYGNHSPWHQSGAIKNVVIEDGVTSIGAEAFYGCWNLESIDLPDGLTSIGDYAFKDCNTHLTSVDLPDGLTSIGNSAFSGCDNLESIALPAGLASIGDAAFYDCGRLTGIEIPVGLTAIGSYTFLNCSSLQKITVNENNMHYSSDETGVLFNKDKTELVAAPGALQTYSVPASVMHIRDTAFSGCRALIGIEFPAGLVSIGNYAFQNCRGLTSIKFPDGLTSIGNAAFEFCSSLTDIELPDRETYIDNYAFACCESLTSITFFNHVPIISYHTFDGVTATAYYPAGHPAWSTAVMRNYGGRITWVPYSEVTEIASGWSGATRWTLTSDGVLTFSGNGNMKNYDWDGGQPWAKYADQIISVVIEEGVTAVGSGAFKDFTKVTRVTLPESGLKTVGEAAFYGCSSLKEIYIPDGVYTIWEYTFKNCTSLKKVSLPNTLIKIDQGAFEGCSAMTELLIPTNTRIIGTWSFKGCTALAEADMQWADATEIREGAFKNCKALTEIALPAEIQVLGDSCFYGIGATSFVIPETVTEIQDWCFARASVTTVTFQGNAPTIGEGAFNKIALTAYYPADNATWTSAIMQNYGGTVTWKPN